MKYYLEITLIENQTCNLYTLWSQVYTQLHLALVEVADEEGKVSIGFSFPEYHYDEMANIGFLGTKCRLFALDEPTLTQLDLGKWLSRLTDNLHCTAIRMVPNIVDGYARYQKLSKKTNLERQARRYAKRKGLSLEEALVKYADFEPFRENFPFVQLKSLSSQQSFRLVIRKTQEAELKTGKFNTYGLSTNLTLPEF
jgi:CRISPR-associated endonuclease Csy4